MADSKTDFSKILKWYEQNALIEFFFYHMPTEQRQQLAAEFPVIYAKCVGKQTER